MNVTLDNFLLKNNNLVLNQTTIDETQESIEHINGIFPKHTIGSPTKPTALIRYQAKSQRNEDFISTSTLFENVPNISPLEIIAITN